MEGLLEGFLLNMQEVRAQQSGGHVSLQPDNANMARHTQPRSVASCCQTINEQTNIMRFILPNNASPALVRHFNDTRSYPIRVLHWMYLLCRERSETKRRKSHWAYIPAEVTDNTAEWRKLYQSKTSLGLRSEELTEERRGS
jgi:hypothetical protein